MIWKPFVPTPRTLPITNKLWRMGDLSFLLHPGQQEIRDWWYKLDSWFAAVCISIQFGKSTLATAIAIEQALRLPDQQITFGAPTAKQAKKIIIPAMKKLLATCPKRLRPRTKDNEYIFPNNSVISVVGVDIDGGDRLRGSWANLVILDEVRDVRNLRSLVENIIRPQFSTTHGRLLMISTPPDSRDHDFVSHYIEMAQPLNAFYHATWHKNPMLTDTWKKETIESYRGGENDISFRREYLADYLLGDPTTHVIPHYNTTWGDEVFGDYTAPDHYILFTSLDVGYHDHTAIITAAWDHERKLFAVLSEDGGQALTTKDIAEKIKQNEKVAIQRAKKSPSKTIRISDIDLRLLADLANAHNLQVQTVTKTDRRLMISKLQQSLEHNWIIVHPLCTKTRHQLSFTQWNRNRTDYVRGTDHSHGDYLDAVKYLNLRLDFNTKPEPQPHYHQNNQLNVMGQQRRPLHNIF